MTQTLNRLRCQHVYNALAMRCTNHAGTDMTSRRVRSTIVLPVPAALSACVMRLTGGQLTDGAEPHA